MDRTNEEIPPNSRARETRVTFVRDMRALMGRVDCPIIRTALNLSRIKYHVITERGRLLVIALYCFGRASTFGRAEIEVYIVVIVFSSYGA